MPNSLLQVLQKNSLWFAILLHLLLLSYISFTFLIPTNKPKETPSLFIPSYLTQNSEQPSVNQQQVVQKKVETSKEGILKPVNAKQAVQSMNQPIATKSAPFTDPVHLIGDKKVDKGLLVVLGKALSAHLVYPKSAVDLRVRGGAVIGFTLHPDGKITDVQLIQSSSADILDKAALAAATAMSPVKNVNSYLAQPKFMVIGVIFGCGLGVRC